MKVIFLLILSLFIFSSPTKADVISEDIYLCGMSKAIDEYYSFSDDVSINRWINGRRISQMSFSESEIEIFERCVEAEATGGTLMQKLNVASCIINRLINGCWSSKLSGVVYYYSNREYQFASVGDGRIWKVPISEETKIACNEVLKNGSIHDALFFCTPDCDSAQDGGWHHDNLDFLFFDGLHRYYKYRDSGGIFR